MLKWLKAPTSFVPSYCDNFPLVSKWLFSTLVRLPFFLKSIENMRTVWLAFERRSSSCCRWCGLSVLALGTWVSPSKVKISSLILSWSAESTYSIAVCPIPERRFKSWSEMAFPRIVLTFVSLKNYSKTYRKNVPLTQLNNR